MNRNVLLAIIAIVVIIGAGLFVFSQMNSSDSNNTQINILSPSALKNGEQVIFELKDSTGTAIPEQNVTIAYDDGSGNIQNYNVITDSNGKGYLAINGEDPGNYDVTITFNGTDKYQGCSAKQTITIEEGTSETAESTESNATASTVMYNNETSATDSSQTTESTVTQTYYDAELNVYYDANGIVIGGQNPGASIYELRYDKNRFDSEGGEL